jgi:hypothetical protein
MLHNVLHNSEIRTLKSMFYQSLIRYVVVSRLIVGPARIAKANTLEDSLKNNR